MKAYLLLGSNLGDSINFLREALLLISEKAGRVIRKSSLYQTAAWGKSDQPDFINQVILLETLLTAQELLRIILEIEKNLGRKRILKWGARTIDIDILFYGKEILNEPHLTIPHPRLHKRRFTLLPLNEIAPHLVHPLLNKKVSVLLNELQDELFVKKLS